MERRLSIFRYQGQYEDAETGLYYNRFRYYSSDEGMYISQDPIRLNGSNNLYGYVHNTNGWIDVLGLKRTNNVRPAPAANGGVGGGTNVHGGTNHNNAIDGNVSNNPNYDTVNYLTNNQSNQNITDIRKNQQQVDINGNIVGSNRPDLQYNKDGFHHNIEYDTTIGGLNAHVLDIPNVDSNSRNTYYLIDPDTGEIIGGFSQLPQNNNGCPE